MKKNTNANLPVLIFMLALLIIWQAGAMGMNAAYILPSPTPDSRATVGTAEARSSLHICPQPCCAQA